MLRPLIVTGASGFLGRHLLDVLKDEWRVFGLARRSQSQSGAPVHPNIRWYQVDIADRDLLQRAFRDIARQGGADTVLHLAAHYDFTGTDHPEYWRTNVEGLGNVLEAGKELGIRRFLFSSSVAACAFPQPGKAITEDTPPDGDHVYAVTKKRGEEMLRDCPFDTTIVRLAAMFSDWCEYPPLFHFLETWLSQRWNARFLGGRGRSAIPYLHVRDAVSFFRTLLEREGGPRRETLVASPDGAVSHRDLFEAATRYFFGQARRPLPMPRLLCAPGIATMDVLGRLAGERPFERVWMARYVDLALTVDSSRTRALLGWEPRPRREILRRLPFLLENLKAEPLEWHRRNRAAMKAVRLASYLGVHRLLEAHAAKIEKVLGERLRTDPERRGITHPALWGGSWQHAFPLHLLMSAVRTRDLSDFLEYCADLARERADQGCGPEEVTAVLQLLQDTCTEIVLADPASEGLLADVHRYVSTTVHFGCDRVADVYDEWEARRGRRARRALVPQA